MTKELYQRVMVTFRPKDQRKDSQCDKIDLFKRAVRTPIAFVEPGRISEPACCLERGVGFDINRYEVPTLMACLTDAEIASVKQLHDVESVSDGCDAPSPQAEEPPTEVPPPGSAQEVPSGVRRIGAPSAWQLARGRGVRVAVIDCGIDVSHPDLAPNCAPGVVLAGGTGLRFSHGTLCGGTIAAIDNDVGVAGVAPDATLVSVKAGPFRLDVCALIAGIEWCLTKEINVINISHEIPDGRDPPELRRMCDLAYRSGILIVASSGQLFEQPEDEAAVVVPTPARYESVIAVSSLDDNNNLASDSGRGPKIELCAPGTGVLSTALGGTYGRESGTSRAAPHVAGAAALVWSANRKLSNVDVRTILSETADDLGGGRSPRFGFGRVNVVRAVERAVQDG
jgi:subtilisin